MTDADRIYRWGILGSGRMAAEFVDELHSHPNAHPVAVASSHLERARDFAMQKGCDRALSSYESLIALSDLDAVYIATTNESHFENAMRCIEKKRPVLVEKPICTRLSDLAVLITAAKSNRVFCMEAMWTLFFPALEALKKTITDLGSVTHVEASFCIRVPFDPRHRLYDPARGGGALLDIGIYPLTFAYFLLGSRPERIDSRLTFAPSGTDDGGEITLVYAGGVRARLVYSLHGESPHRAEIHCERGRVTVDNFFHPSQITTHPEGRAPLVQTFEYPLKGYNFEIDEVHAALAEGAVESDIMPLEKSFEILTAMEKILADNKKH